MNQALVYFIVQLLCAYDVTQTVFIKAETVRDEGQDIVDVLRVCPMLQAKVQNQLPELKCDFEYVKPGCLCDCGEVFTWRKFRTQVASLCYFLCFTGLNYVCSEEPDSL